MLTKYLLLAISSLALNHRESATDSQDSMMELIKSTIRVEISAIAYKLLVAIVLVSTLIFSIIQFAYAFQTYLSQFQNGFVIELVSFGTVAVICAVALYLLFNQRGSKMELASVKVQPLASALDLQNLAVRFTEGIVEGLESKNQAHRATASAMRPEREPVLATDY